MQEVDVNAGDLLHLGESGNEMPLGIHLESIDQEVYDGDSIFHNGRVHGFFIFDIENQGLGCSGILPHKLGLIFSPDKGV